MAIGKLPAPVALGAAACLGRGRFAIMGGEDGSRLAAGIFVLTVQR